MENQKTQKNKKNKNLKYQYQRNKIKIIGVFIPSTRMNFLVRDPKTALDE